MLKVVSVSWLFIYLISKISREKNNNQQSSRIQSNVVVV